MLLSIPDLKPEIFQDSGEHFNHRKAEGERRIKGQEKLFTTRGNERRIPLNIKKHLFTVKERGLAKVVQRDCGVFLFRKTQEVSGHGPEQPAPGGPTGDDGLSSSCQSILQFCLIAT